MDVVGGSDSVYNTKVSVDKRPPLPNRNKKK